MESTITIYALCCPDIGEVRYIGKANDMEKRLKSHVADMGRRDYPLYRWMRKLNRECKLPVVKAISTACDATWQQEEIDAIRRARESGARLLNIADGGQSPFCPHEVRVENGRKAAIARVSTEEKRRYQEVKYRAREVVKWLKSRGKWDEPLGLKVRSAMRLLASRKPEYFSKWADV